MPELTQERLKELLHYNPDTGIFTWLELACRKMPAGSIAGCKNCHGYVQIKVIGRQYPAHRLAWFYVYGEFPEDQLDHINHDGIDNRIGNLRLATDLMNKKNFPKAKNNSSGFTGVHWNKAERKWRAQIMIHKKNIHLGTFDRKGDAIKARKAANIKYGFHENHGK